jgi:hypothetical protein
MATVIDSLIVTLGLDNKDFQQGMKDTEKGLSDTRKNTDRVGKQIAASGKDAAEFFGQMQRSAIKFFAVLTAGKGLINFTRDVVTTGANLYRLSQNLDISADTLHRWGRAADLNGGSMEGFLGTLQNLGSQVTEIFMKGDSAITPYLRQLGVSVTDAAGKAKPLTDILADIASSTEKAFPDRQQRYAYLKQMGFDEGTVNLLVKGGKELRNVIAAQQEYSDKDNKAAFEAEQTWIKAQQRLEKLTRDLVIKVLPSLERLIETFVKFAEVIIPPLSKAVEIFAELDEKTDGWSTSLILALATLRLLGGSAVIGGIASLSATIAGLAAGAASLAAPLGFLLYSGGLNKGEDEELRKLQGENYMGPTVANKKGSSVAERHNNPGNLVFAGQRGATVGETVAGHTFAKFKSTEEGIAALYRQLQLYQKRGIDTLTEVMGVYAPEGANNTGAYINALSKSTGLDPNQQLNFNDPATAAAMIRGISQHEAGRSYLNDQQILSGISMAQGGGGGSSSVSIGQITVQTQATDARGIAAGLKGEVVRQFDAGMR